MTDETANLILEQLRLMRNETAAFRRNTEDKLLEISMRITSLEHQVSLIRQDMAVLSERMDRIEMRLMRIERRLNLVEESPGG